MTEADITEALQTAANWLRQADGLLITAGAGMGVDSGLPDFRGDAGLWQHYPALGERQKSFSAIANPYAFVEDPSLAWGFYGHRLNLYRQVQPHAGFAELLELSTRFKHGSFVVTSNVDGQFQKAGFDEDRVVEYHGSIHHLQCLKPCQPEFWSAKDLVLDVDEGNCELRSAPPRCPHCGRLARPNILMFGDGQWLDNRRAQQYRRWEAWRRQVNRLVVLELGAGKVIASMRTLGERQQGLLIRVNPRDYQVSAPNHVGIALGAAEGIHRLKGLFEKG